MRRLILAGCIAGCLAASGCDDESAPTSREVQREYVSKFVQGFSFGEAGVIRAAHFDADTLDMTDISITDNAGNLYHAERGVVIVDASKDTVSIQLLNITGADPVTGELFTTPSLVTPPEKIKGGVR